MMKRLYRARFVVCDIKTNKVIRSIDLGQFISRPYDRHAIAWRRALASGFTAGSVLVW